MDDLMMREHMAGKRSHAPQGPVAWVLTRVDLMHAIEAMRNAAAFVFDLETTGLDEHATTGGLSNGGVAARVSMLMMTLPQKDESGWWDGAEPTTYVVPLSHPRSPFLGEWAKVLRLIARAAVKYQLPTVGHNVRFDTRWTYAHTGVSIAPYIAWDTKDSSYLLDETTSNKLKEVAPETFGIPRWDDHDLSYPGASEEVDIWELGEYGARDAYWTWRTYLAHLRELFLDPADPFAEPLGRDETANARIGQVAKYVMVPTARSLGGMEQRGIMLDLRYVDEQLTKKREEAEQAIDELAERWGMPRGEASTASASGWFKEMAERAEEAGELRVISMTGAGNPQWTKHVLGKLARRGSRTAELVLAARDAEKQAQFLRSWQEKVAPSGAIHATFNTGRVVTGRLSSSDPNLQQVSKKLKPAFIPRPGHLLAEIDYSQLELRVAAFMSRCEPMLNAYAAGQDLHALFAADQLTRRARHDDPNAPLAQIENVPPGERQKAKAGNFGLLYEQTPAGFRAYADKVYGVEMTEEEALEVYNGFFETWDGMHEWHARVKRKAASLGYVTSPIGRRRMLPNILDGNEYYRSEAERQAINAPVQGFGSDLMQMAIASIMGYMPGTSPVEGAHPVATVHDSVVVEVREDGWERIVAECQERMVDMNPHLARFGVMMDVPLQADAQIGSRWGLSDAGEM